jgi:hypothetical protein
MMQGALVLPEPGEFACIEEGHLTEFRVILDLPALFAAAGHPLLPTSRGAEIDVPPPADANGKPYRFHPYEGDEHMFRGQRLEQAIDRDSSYFRELLQSVP